MARRGNPWFGIGLNAWSLGLESSTVIGLRMARIAAGGAAGEAEARRMVSEKMDAAVAWQTLALTGGLGLTPASVASRTLSHYRRKVNANRRRLTKN